MKIVLNGHAREISGPLSIESLLLEEGFGARRVAVEVNREIVPRSAHGARTLAEGDRVEIVHALGGG